MDDGQLKGIIEAEIDSAIGFLQSETTDQRQRALEYYLRQNFGNEVEGRSQVVTGEVAEAVDAALPQLIKIFQASGDIVRFEPVGVGDEEGAKQASDYVNWVFYKDNNGMMVMHDWFKDALLQKTGVVKAYWDVATEVNTETYNDLTDMQLTALLSDSTYEIVSQDTIEQPTDQVDEMGQPLVLRSHSVEIRKREEVGRVRIENVPPEEFLISKKGRTIKDSPFVGHRRLTTKSELISMGYDESIVASLPVYDDLTFSAERIARFGNEENPDEDSLDKSMQTTEVYELYIRTDYDDDGIAELRRVVYAGSEILYNEPTDYCPFYSLCPLPIPHKFYGESLADRAQDLQLIKSTIVRQMLDNLYLTNNTRVGAVEGQVNLDDLLSMTPGGVVRMKNPNGVVPLTVQPVANQAFPMLEYLDAVQAKRTGISDMSQGLDPNILQNVTAAAVAATTRAASGKIELIARIFAETGVKELMAGILHLVCKYQDKPRMIRMRGKFVEMDPRQWSNQYDVSISVGLGTGDKAEQMAMLQMVLAKQEEMLTRFGPNNPMVSLGQYRNTLGRFLEAAGMHDSAEYFNEITPEVEQALAQPQEQQPDPALQAMMMQAQAQIQIDREKAAADIQLAREKAEAQMALKREELTAELAMKQEEFQAEAALKAAKIGAGITSNVNIPKPQ